MRKIINRSFEICVACRNSKLGQGYTEYVILLALIALVAYAAVQLIGSNVSSAFSSAAPSV
jgi:hypothetical protein